MSILPIDDELELLHSRQYEVHIYQLSDDELVARGVVSDVKPPGLYVADDPDPLEVHQMQLELRITASDLTIRDAGVIFETHPHSICPLIARDYKALIGVSIARGFNREVRQLFGGERGCTHTNALLQAMAPAVIQARWSTVAKDARAKDPDSEPLDNLSRKKQIAANVNTCHVWAEDSEYVAGVLDGSQDTPPVIPIRERLLKLGRDPLS